MLIVLKYGGNAMAPPPAPDLLLDDVAVRVAAGDRVVLVHGGGPQIDAELRESGLAQRRIAGLRVTDAATLAITERVLCGTVNKALVRALPRQRPSQRDPPASFRGSPTHSRDWSRLRRFRQ